MKVVLSADGQLTALKSLLRIHVTSAYFARTGEGSPDTPINKKGLSVFKVAMDTQRKPKGQCPKEVRNRPKPQK